MIARRTAVELWGIAREMVRIPAALFMRVAEILGAWVLRGWLLLWPVLVAGVAPRRPRVLRSPSAS